MIDNYLYTIGKLLSPKMREDVLKEIRSNIYDFLEEQFGSKTYSDEEMELAIRSLGHPKRVAEAYNNGPRCLIGPAYIDTYWLVLKIAIIGSTIGVSVSYIMSGAPSVVQFAIQLITQTWQAALSAVGMVTIIFAAIHHYSPEYDDVIDEQWSLDVLEVVPEKNQTISRSELIAGSFFIVLGLYWLNQSMPIIGVGDGVNVIIPTFNQALFRGILPFINITLIVSLISNIYLLIKGKWETGTRLIEILIDLAIITLIWWLFLTPDLIDLSEVIVLSNQTSSNLLNVLAMSARISLAVITVVNAYEIIQHVKYLLKNRK